MLLWLRELYHRLLKLEAKRQSQNERR
jgi:hypothetical protein